MRKKTLLFAITAICACLFAGLSLAPFIGHGGGVVSKTAPVGEEEDGPDKEARIRAYEDLIHRAAPGTDWRAIELQNALDAEQYRYGGVAYKTAGSFAGGLINGTWYERGNNT